MGVVAPAERRETQTRLLSSAVKSGFPVLYAPLEQVLGSFLSVLLSPGAAVEGQMEVVWDGALEGRLAELFAGAGSLTARENLLLSLRHRLLVEVATQQGIGKVGAC